ncbi:MAG: nitroreductase family protein [Bdellovibrionales bacterium]
MDLAQLTVSRRTVHNYKPDKIADDLVTKALELSLWAPNHKLTYPWVYIWVGAAARLQLADLAAELKALKKPLSETEKKAVSATVTNPSHLIALGLKRSADAHRQHEDYATLACSVQIAAQYLWDQGIGSKWTTAGWSTHARSYDILGVSPEEVSLEGAFMIGVPLIVPAATPRPSLDKFLRRVE